MVYLIDDKKYRQEHDYHWDSQIFNDFSSVIKPLYHIEELTSHREQIFRKENIVLYHESFLDNTTSSSISQRKRIELEKFAEKNPEFNLAIFSGSKFSRNLFNNIAHLPVAVLYNNLGTFLNKLSFGEKNLNYLLFGESPLIEKQLNDMLNEAQVKIGKEHPAKIKDKTNLVLRPVRGYISNAIEDADEEVVFNKDLSDQKLSEYINKWLDDTKYDNIFIPLCFGSVLSDFNGLRFAAHIRCTDMINQFSRIYIYGYAGIEYLINHECFNILKTKNVELIPFSRFAIEKSGNLPEHEFTSEFLYEEIKKLKLDVPKDYDDNHSINNEWAINQWTYCIPEPIYDRVENILNKVENRLYFKYLNTLRSTQLIQPLKEEDLKILKTNKERVLFVDNDYEKGWKVLFNYLLTECNNLQMDTLEIDYRSLSREEIINSAYVKVIDPTTQSINYDVVILDFRLHPSDNDETNIDLITGTQILKRLKAINPGIQVVIFSATNKIWNLQTLQKEGADGFILKESPLNSSEVDFTRNVILDLIITLNRCLKRAYLKQIWKKFQLIIDLDKSFNNHLEIAFKLLYLSGDTNKYKNYAFLQLFLIIEEFIQQENVFIRNDQGLNFVIGNNGNEILVFEKIGDKTDNKFKSAIKFSSGNYKPEKCILCRRLDTNTIVSSLLLFRYGLNTSGELKWTSIYTTRNNKAAHPEKGIVSNTELYKLVDFLIYILNEKNIKNNERAIPLEMPTIDDQIQKLKERWN